MLFVFIVAIISTFLAYTSKYKNPYGLEMAFIFITTFLALRYNFGSDYPAYMEMFEYINNCNVSLFDFQRLGELNVKGEIGWIIINKLFKPLGFFGLVFFLAIFENIIIYKFIKRYVEPNYYWMTVFIYTFTATIFLIGACSMFRQWLTAILMLWSSKYIIEKKPIKYFSLTVIAISIHTTAWIMVPLYLLSFFKGVRDFNWKYAIIVVILYFIWCTYMPKFMSANLDFLFQYEDMQYYEHYMNDEIRQGSMSIFGFISYSIANILLPIIVMSQMHKMSRPLQIISLLYLCYLLVIPFESLLPLISRMKYYFILFILVALPSAFKTINGKNATMLAYAIFALYILFTIRELFAITFHINWKSFETYQTIFSAPHWI